MTDARSHSFRQLLRWYPSGWRLRNEDAMVGIMLDHADDTGRDGPTLAERIGFATGGLRERLRFPARGRRGALVPWALAAALSAFYLTIIWSPSRRYDGFVGPFSNAGVITCALVLVGFLAALGSQRRVAVVLAVAAIAVEIVSVALSGIYSWMGPGVGTGVLFVGLLLLAIVPLRRMSGIVAGCGILFALVDVMTFGPRLFEGVGSVTVVTLVALAVALLVLAGSIALVVRGASVARVDRSDEFDATSRHP